MVGFHQRCILRLVAVWLDRTAFGTSIGIYRCDSWVWTPDMGPLRWLTAKTAERGVPNGNTELVIQSGNRSKKTDRLGAFCGDSFIFRYFPLYCNNRTKVSLSSLYFLHSSVMACDQHLWPSLRPRQIFSTLCAEIWDTSQPTSVCEWRWRQVQQRFLEDLWLEQFPQPVVSACFGIYWLVYKIL